MLVRRRQNTRVRYLLNVYYLVLKKVIVVFFLDKGTIKVLYYIKTIILWKFSKI